MMDEKAFVDKEGCCELFLIIKNIFTFLKAFYSGKIAAFS